MSDETPIAETTGTVVESTQVAKAEPKSKAVPSVFAKEETPVVKTEVAEEAHEDNDTEETATSDGADAPAHPKNKGVGKRINELTREKYDAIRERDYWKAEAEKAKAPAETTNAQVVQDAPKGTGEPKLEDFDFDVAKFNRAQYEYLKEQDRRQETAKQKAQTFVEKVKAFEAEHPDYHDVTSDPSLPLTQQVVGLILETENPPQIAYYLAKNPEEAATIAAMNPVNAARAIGRIEAKLEQAPAVVRELPKKTTNAPPPPKTVSGAGKSSVNIYDKDLSPEQRIAYWRAQRKPR